MVHGLSFDTVFKALGRRKTFEDDSGKSQLARVLTTLDLTALGVGSTLGLGAYVLAGSEAKADAGPAVCISFLIAAIASTFAALCYAEFAAIVPKAGSAYVYSYVTVGEFIAFVIGWNLILEYMIGTASVARAFTGYLDVLLDHQLSHFLTDVVPMGNIQLGFISINTSQYLDLASFAVVMLLTMLLAFGVKESTTFNNLFTILNLTTIGIVLVAGVFKADVKNWSISPSDVPPDTIIGAGGFAPFGISGIMAGAATCFYGFVGFDAIATTGEEAKNPQRAIPIAIIVSLIIIFLAYFGISVVITLMWPFYDLNPEAPFPDLFEKVNMPSIKLIVTIGATCALCTSLLGAIFPLPRIIYAMANDGLLFKSLSSINSRTKTPIFATILSGFFAGALASLLDIQSLIEMMSMGTLLAYTLVSGCVLLLRYKPTDSDLKSINGYPANQMASIFRQIFNVNLLKTPTEKSSVIVNYALCVYSFFTAVASAVVIFYEEQFLDRNAWFMGVFGVAIVGMLTCVMVITQQPISDRKLHFKVPFVPVLPCLSISMNIVLMLKLNASTWERFVYWVALGLLIYFAYGIFNSTQKTTNKFKRKTLDVKITHNQAHISKDENVITKGVKESSTTKL